MKNISNFKAFMIVISILVLINILLKIIERSNIEQDIIFYEQLIEEEYDLLISFKNTGRRWGIYLSKTESDISRIKQKKYPIGDPYKVPQYPDIEFSIKPTQRLYDNCEIYDRIQKLANSNKCILYRKDSVFRYNCHIIPDNIREKIIVDEWNEEEVGFWKLGNAPKLVTDKK